MRLVTWNCNGAFRNCFREIQKFDADIYLIQECEDPLQSTSKEYKEFAKNYLFIGSKNKGIGIFAKEDIILNKNDWKCDIDMKYYLPCTINNDLTLVVIWSHEKRKYIEEIFDYTILNRENLIYSKNLMVAGDFNSNKIWDKFHGRKNHSVVVNELKNINLDSCYHIIKGENHGEETSATFYNKRNKYKPFHIDYIFYDKDKINSINIGDYDEWGKISDHMPMVLDFSL